MKTKLLYTSVLMICWLQAFGQNLGLNTTTPDPSALVDMGQMPKGLLVPRMTQAERLAISNPSPALLVFQTDHPSGFYFYDVVSSGWKQMTGNNAKVRDTDDDTYMHTEASPDEDVIRIRLGGLDKVVFQKNINAAFARVGIVNNQGNIFIGDSTATNAGSMAQNNVAIQFSALKNTSSGKNNVAIGSSVLSAYNSDHAVGIGFEALKNASSFDLYNTALGYRSNINGGGDASVVIGSEASPKSAYSTTVSIGKASGATNVSGFANIMVGAESMASVQNASNNVAIGFRTMYQNQLSNNRNIIIGSEAGHRGWYNMGIGYKTLTVNNDDYNIAIGSQSLSLHQTEEYNTAVGFSALKNHVYGRNNIALGSYSMEQNINGRHNIGVGYRSLYGDQGKYNIGIGSNAFSVSGGNTERNLAVGAETQTEIIPGNDNIIVGYQAAAGPGVHHSIVLGSHAYADSSYTVILGSVAGKNGATETVQVGLGTSTPHPSAIFEMKSTDKPFYMPYGVEGLIGNPAEGLLCNFGPDIYFFNGTDWQNINGTDLYDPEGATLGETFVIRNQTVVKGYPNAIQDGESIISKATIEENENENKFHLRLHGDPVLTIGENANGQLLIETLSNNKSILSGTYEMGTSSETTLLCKLNEESYADGNTIAGDYVLFNNSQAINFVGLGLGAFSNYDNYVDANDESVGIGHDAGANMSGPGYTIAGHHVSEQDAQAFRNNMLIIGHNVRVLANNQNATVIGHDAQIRCSNCVVIGNEKEVPVMTDEEQDVGIGSTAPQSALHIEGPGTVDHPHLRLEKTNLNSARLAFRNPVNNVQNFLMAEPAATNNNAVFQLGTTSNGMMMRLFGNGNATIVSLAQSSDSILKKDIIPLNTTLTRLQTIQPIHYTWKDEQKGTRQQTGFNAQEVESVFPELTNENEDGFKTVNYAGMNAVLWQSLRELMELSEGQSARLDAQEARIQVLTERLEKLNKNKQNLVAHEKN